MFTTEVNFSMITKNVYRQKKHMDCDSTYWRWCDSIYINSRKENNSVESRGGVGSREGIASGKGTASSSRGVRDWGNPAVGYTDHNPANCLLELIIKHANKNTSISRSWRLGLWMKKVKFSSHTGSLVLYRIWKIHANVSFLVFSVERTTHGVLTAITRLED